MMLSRVNCVRISACSVTAPNASTRLLHGLAARAHAGWCNAARGGGPCCTEGVAMLHGLAAWTHRPCSIATRSCSTDTQGVQHCYTALQHGHAGCAALLHGL